ncbi:MAG: sugar ABC transporter ATP-binding protein [Alkalispirochaeta sp.]
MSGASKRFGETQALDNVSLELASNEVHCLVGENGAGKSTLIKILAGAENPDAGTITISGRRYANLEPDTAMELGIATIYQDVELISSLTVAENIFLGREIRRFGGSIIDFKKQEQDARLLMDGLNISIPEWAIVDTLSPADQQTLQIVKAMGRDARIMIMDEPTSSLGLQEARALMKLIRDLRDRGIGIIYISHHLEEVFEIGDRITILKDGRVVKTVDRGDATQQEVTTAMVGRESPAFHNRSEIRRGSEVVQAEGLSKDGMFSDCSFQVRAGEILGIGGLVGSGRSELVRVLFGDMFPDSGQIMLRGEPYVPVSPKDAIHHGIAYVGEDRHIQGLFPGRPVLENVSVIHNESSFMLNHRVEAQLAFEATGQMNMVMAGLSQRAGSLSGGNQQKAIIARWLLAEFDLLILDEPTKGVDVGAKSQIYQIMDHLVEEGKAIIMVSSDMPELISMSDRIAVMRRGRIVRVIDSKDADEQQLVNEYLGLTGAEENER